MAGHTLSKAQRLTKASLFREAFAQNPGMPGRCMVLWLRAGEGADLRLGVISSRKVSNRAVDRNLARRRLREAFRRLRPELLPGADVVLIARHSILKATQAEVDDELRRLMKKAALL